ncbi:MAG: SAM-dependent methyltransferase [Acidobacteriota bacterium]
MNENIDKFIKEFEASLAGNSFVKLTLGNYKGSPPELQKILIRPIETQAGPKVSFVYRYKTRDVAKSVALAEAGREIHQHLSSGFRTGHLVTLSEEIRITLGKRSSRIFKNAAVHEKPLLAHNRPKTAHISENAPYLRSLGITSGEGRVYAPQQNKWRQINKFVEILNGLWERSSLRDERSISIVDMGSGKGYLTFAAYDHFANNLGLDVEMRGIDTRADMVDLCNSTAHAIGYSGLKFIQGEIGDFDTGPVDILIALHACDTATDDAIFKAVSSKAVIVVAAPCCHREVRRQMSTREPFSGILKHPVMIERTAETITDGIRSLLLERIGYSTKLFEFVPTEHTPKNNMLVAVKNSSSVDKRAAGQIADIMTIFGIRHHRLKTLLDQWESDALSGSQSKT